MTVSLEDHAPHVFRFAIRLTGNRHWAEDLTQDVMLRAVDRIDQLKDKSRVRFWLFRIAANLWKDHVRRDKRNPTVHTAKEQAANKTSAETRTEHREELQEALDAMSHLPERQRSVLYLFAVEEMTLPEISDVLDIKSNTAKVNLFHARRAMRAKLPHIWETAGVTAK